MNRIAFIDHAYHKKTRSSEFFEDFLKTIGTVEFFWDNPSDSEDRLDLRLLNESEFDLLVFWQMLYPAAQLAKLRCRAIVIVPMYDSVGDVAPHAWLEYRPYFFVCFSTALFQSLQLCGVPSFYLQYFPDPKAISVSTSRDFAKVFYWERREDVPPSLVQKWFSSCKGFSFHHHFSPDPGTNLIEAPLTQVNWSRSHWYPSRNAYNEVLDACGVYIAPRKREGIGMSFLEAMAKGMVVVGFRAATLSEYVTHGKNGLLIDEDSVLEPQSIDWASIGLEARRSVESGFVDFQKRIALLGEILNRPPRSWPRRKYGRGFLKCLLRRMVLETTSMTTRALRKLRVK